MPFSGRIIWVRLSCRRASEVLDPIGECGVTGPQVRNLSFRGPPCRIEHGVQRDPVDERDKVAGHHDAICHGDVGEAIGKVLFPVGADRAVELLQVVVEQPRRANRQREAPHFGGAGVGGQDRCEVIEGRGVVRLREDTVEHHSHCVVERRGEQLPSIDEVM